MRECIFCPTALTPDTKPEHIWLNALGGRATTRGVICSECNNTFGSTIDATLVSQFQDLRTILNLRSGDKKTPPPLSVAIEGGQRFSVWPDGRLEVRQKPFKIEKRENGFDVTITARDLKQLNDLVPHVAAAIGISEENLRSQLGRATAREVIRPAPQLSTNITFGGHDALRSLAKSCLVLWNKNCPDTAIKEPPFEAIKTFILNGDHRFLSESVQLDGRVIPGADLLENEFGPIFNLIFLKSDDRGRILAYVGMDNTAYWRIVVTKEGGAPNQAIGLVSNPRTPNNWTYLPNSAFNLQVSWLETPVINESARNPGVAISNALKSHSEEQRRQHIDEILVDTLKECNISEGDVITEEAIAKLSTRVAHWFLRVPSDRTLSEDELRVILSFPNEG